MRLKYLISTLLFALSAQIYAQYVTVEDIVFARFLCDNYPDVMSLDCTQLDTVKAADITGNMVATGLGITSVAEAVFFKQVSKLDFGDNEITALPDLSKFTNLKIINFNGNKLTGVLDFSANTTLEMIIMNRNEGVTGFTGIAQLTNLNSLQFIACSLSSLPDMNSVANLTYVLLYQNRLTFADLYPLLEHANFSTDFRLFYQNKVTSDTVVTLPEGATYTIGYNLDQDIVGLTYKWFRNNELIKTSNEDYYTVTNLSSNEVGGYQLVIYSDKPEFADDSIVSGIWNCQIKSPEPLGFTIADIDFTISDNCNLPNVSISTLLLDPEISDYNITAKNIDFHLTESLQLGVAQQMLPGTYDIVISADGYTEEVAEKLFFVDYVSGCVVDTVIEPNSTVLLKCALTDQLAFSSIEWFKNGSLVGLPNAQLELPDFQKSDAGLYYCKMYYTGHTGAEQSFTSQKWNCKSDDCFSITGYELEQSKSCTKIEMKIASIFSERQEMGEIFLVNKFNGDSTAIGSTEYASLVSGNYQLIMESEDVCDQVLSSDITLQFNAECNHYFTPNGDGVNDEWFIEYTGLVQIFDGNGTLVKKLDCPAVWDGSSENRTMVPDGKYLILYDDRSKEAVTVFR